MNSLALTLLLTFSPLDLMLPNKLGGSATWHRTPEENYEVEYLRARLSVPFVIADLGGMTDERISVNRRWIADNGFNFYFGGSIQTFDIDLGSKYLASVSRNTSYEALRLRTLGVNAGLGHRWVIKENYVFAVDWAAWSQPLFVLERHAPYVDATRDSGHKSVIEKALDTAAYFPRWSVLKLSLGIKF